MASIAKETNLPKNSKYMRGMSERKDYDVQLEKSSAAAHIKRQMSLNNKDGKMPKAHSSYSEPSVYTSDNTDIRYEKAAELKKNLEREISLEQMNDKISIKKDAKSFSEGKGKADNVSKDGTENNPSQNKYFLYKKAKNENKYRKRVYKIEKKYRLLYSDPPNANRLTILRKLSILNQNVIAPIKKENPLGVVTAPTFIFIKSLLEKYKLGRIATRTQEASNRIVSAVENTADTSQAMSAVTQKAAKEAVKGTAGTVYRYIDRKRQKKLQENKYLKEAAKAELEQYITNIRYIKTRDAILAQEKDFNSGKVPDKLAKKIENFNKKEEQKKTLKKIEEKNKKLEKKIHKQHRPYNNTLKKIIKKKSKAKLLGMMAASGLSFIVPIIVVIVIIIALFSWISPYSYSIAGDKSEKQTEAKTSKEIIDGYAKLIQNYMDVTQAYYYLNYGDWYGGVYNYPAPEISFTDYFEQFTNKIIKQIEADFADALAAAKTPEESAAIGRAMESAISDALQGAEAQAQVEYDHLMKALDEIMRAKEHRQHYEVSNGGGGNGVLDSEEFTGQPIVGTNHFNNVEIKSDLSAEELIAMIGLYKTLMLINSNDTDTDTEDDTEIACNITPNDIMDFFKKTEYISVTTQITHGHPCGGRNCKRRLKGDYESGYSWEYFCDNDHDWLSGVITCKTKEELIQKILELTKAKENDIDEKSAKEIIDEYIKTINDELGITKNEYRKFGAADNVMAKKFYEMLIDPEQGVIPNNYWTVDTPWT